MKPQGSSLICLTSLNIIHYSRTSEALKEKRLLYHVHIQYLIMFVCLQMDPN